MHPLKINSTNTWIIPSLRFRKEEKPIILGNVNIHAKSDHLTWHGTIGKQGIKTAAAMAYYSKEII